MPEFRKRFYHNPLELGRDVRRLLAQRREISPLMQGESLDPAFRERLMLTVTAVNRCRYCSYAHARMALREGLPLEEIQRLDQADLGDCPPQELPALLYAQHWAETDGQADPLARQALVDRYGEAQVQAIELALRMMRTANLAGNSLDYILFRLSFGRLGQEDAPLVGRSHPAEY